MKTITKMMLAICLCCFVSFANAKDIYVSATGSDDNSGTSEATAFKSLSKVNTVIQPGDVLYVSGMLDITAEPKTGPWDQGKGGYLMIKNGQLAGFFLKANNGEPEYNNWNNVTIKGTDPEKDGFDAKHKSRCISMDGGTFVFENLCFKNGRDICDDGGNGVWSRSSTATFLKCRFIDNTVATNPEPDNGVIGGRPGSNGRGGAFFLHNTKASFYDCYFSGNTQKSGAAILVIGGELILEGCTFDKNGKSADERIVRDSNGGAIQLWALNGDITSVINNCLFKGNIATEGGGAIAIRQDSDRGEGKTWIRTTITNCAFIKNNSGGAGGAISHKLDMVNVLTQTVVANCTFYGNTAANYGGAIDLAGGSTLSGSTFDIVNCTLNGNITSGNVGHCGGLTTRGLRMGDDQAIHYPSTGLLKCIYNSIFDGNTTIEDMSKSDLSVLDNTTPATEFTISNSFIDVSPLSVSDFEGTNLFSYSTDLGDNYLKINDYGDFYPDDFSALPFLDDSPVYGYGDVAYLKQTRIPQKEETFLQYDIKEADQFGKKRTIDGTKCIVGACEVIVTEFDDSEYPFPILGRRPIPSNIVNAKVKSGGFTIADGSIEMDQAELTIMNMSGMIVKKGVGQASLSELPQGIYIVKAVVNGQVFVQKFMK